MKTYIKHLFLVPALIAGLSLVIAGRATAQTFRILYGFTASSGPYPGTNSDGAGPNAGLVLSGNTLYGTAAGGGTGGNGTVFAINPDGTGFTNLYVFSPNPAPNSTNSDGAGPYAGLLLSGNTLYGTTVSGGAHSEGTVFAISTNGTGFTNLYSFPDTSGFPSYTNKDGANPNGELILSDNTVYGTALNAGVFGGGTVFRVNTNGTGFTNLHSFAAISEYPNNTNSDGASPACVLVLSDNTLYGTASDGGTNGSGTLFAVNTDGTGFRKLHTFTVISNSPPYGNSDGANPSAGLILSGYTLYGTAGRGGSGGSGTVFSINTNGTGFTTLHSFAAGGFGSISGGQTNSDGAFPAGLLSSGNTLYGTTGGGGSSGSGTVFELNTDGTGFKNLYYFTSLSAPFYAGGTNSDGASPNGELILSGNTLYGTADYGGLSGNGTVFSLSFAPQLTIIFSEAGVILTWPTNYAGFTLQSTTNLDLSAVWATNSPAPVVVNGQNTVTNPLSGTQQFYRLSQ